MTHPKNDAREILAVLGYTPPMEKRDDSSTLTEDAPVVRSERRWRFDSWVDVFSVLLISAATVLTAWCGYEGARWTAIQTREYNLAAADRVAASVAAERTNTLQMADLSMFLQYVAAYAARNQDEVSFIYERFRPEMKRAVDAWVATKPRRNKSAPSSPFVMSQYRLATKVEAQRLNALAAANFATAVNANEKGDAFVRLTVIFAAVSFLAGMSTKFVFPYHIVVIVAGIITLIFGILRMFGLPML